MRKLLFLATACFVLLIGCVHLAGGDDLVKSSALNNDVDPCNRPRFCATGSVTPDPENCTLFYLCDNSLWIVMPCAPGSQFDSENLTCGVIGYVKCQEPCPPFTGSTPEPVTIEPGLCDRINFTDPCIPNDKYADRSDCQWYYLCFNSNGIYTRQFCGAGNIFDIHTSNCGLPDNNFNCEYRCLTPPPPTGITSPVVTTTLDLIETQPPGQGDMTTSLIPTTKTPVGQVTTSILPSTSPGQVTSSISPSTTDPAPATPSPGGTDIGIIVSIVVGVVVLIIIVIIVVVYFVKKHKKNGIDPELNQLADDDSLEKDLHADQFSNSDDKKPILLPPLVIAAAAGTKAATDGSKKQKKPKKEHLSEAEFIEKVEKSKKKSLKPFRKTNPNKDEAKKTADKYRKTVIKDLHLRYDSEEKLEEESYEDELEKLRNDSENKRTNFLKDLAVACEHSDPDEVIALANNHVNTIHADTMETQGLMDRRHHLLRQRLLAMDLSTEDMRKSGLLLSDLDGTELNEKVNRFNEEQKKLKDKFLSEFVSQASSGATKEDLERLVENYEKEQKELEDLHIQERKTATLKLQTALNIMAKQNVDKLFNKQCDELQNEFDYETNDPTLLKTTLTGHLEALETTGKDLEKQMRLTQVQYTAVKIDTSKPMTNQTISTTTIVVSPGDDGLVKGRGTGDDLPNGSVIGHERGGEDNDLPNGFPVRQVQPEDLKEEQKRIMDEHEREKQRWRLMREDTVVRNAELLQKMLSEKRGGHENV